MGQNRKPFHYTACKVKNIDQIGMRFAEINVITLLALIRSKHFPSKTKCPHFSGLPCT